MKPWDDVFGEAPASFEDRVQATLRDLEDNTGRGAGAKRGKHPARTGALIALAAVLLTGSALAVTARIRLVEEPQTVSYEATGETGEALILDFEATDGAPVHLGVWELTGVPDGYERADVHYRLVPNGAEGGERWENAAGDGIGLTYQAAYQGYGQLGLNTADIQKREDITVGGSPGTLYTQTDGYQLLRWIDEQRGIGFTLSAPVGVDVLALAESVRETGDVPELSEETVAALEQLGAWSPTVLPEGYGLYFSNGWPGDYAYVYRTYENGAHYKLYLNYEAAVYTDDIENCVANYRELAELAEAYGNSDEDGVRVEKYTITELTVQGMDARFVRYEDGTPCLLAWMDSENKLVFFLQADALTAEELLAAAESVARVD